MTSNIFLIQNDRSLVRMNEARYDTEDLLQALIANYPDLLAGDQMDSSDPRRWLLVRREMGVPGEEDGNNRWSIDHVFLDQDAIPTLIEVKRSSDTRIRREVVGQMLDYAANAVVYWPVEQLRAQFERECESKQRDPDEVLNEFLGAGADIEAFWQKAKTNLQAGKVRMVFVADVIPNELKRIVEFLNEQMDPAEVLAVEIKQYVGEGLQSLVPRVIGQTAEAERKKSVGGREHRKWSEESFFADLETRKGAEQAQVAKTLYDWARTKTDRFSWGDGKKDGSFSPVLDDNRGKQRLFIVYSSGRVQIPFATMGTSLPFSDLTLRTQLLTRLNEIKGLDFEADAVNLFWPTFEIAVLTSEPSYQHFVKTMEWAVDQIKATAAS